MKRGWRGIYSLHTKPLHTFDPTRSDRIGELSETDSVQNVNVRILGRTDWINSVGPMSLGLGHNVISVRPITQSR